LNESTLAGLFARIDGLLLVEGDVDPEWYVATPTAVVAVSIGCESGGTESGALGAPRRKPVFGMSRTAIVECGRGINCIETSASIRSSSTPIIDYPL